MQEGLFDRQYGYYAVQVGILFALLGASAAGIVLLEPFILKLLLVVPFTMAVLQAAYMGHDLGHRQVFKTTRANDRFLVFISIFIGASRSWWMDTHNKHHDHPNDQLLDPNLRVPFLAFSREQAEHYGGFVRALMRFQGVYFWGFVMLEGLAMKVHSARFLLTEKNLTYRPYEIVMLVTHFALLIGLVAATMTLAEALVWLTIHHVLHGLYIGLVFAPNHKGMPLLEDVEADDFLTQQVVTTRNVRDFFGATWLVGGLHYQIEHHLFVNMPRSRLRDARLLVKPFCDERNVSYVETGLFESYAQVSRNFAEIAK
jgi:fatty acid desaturase